MYKIKPYNYQKAASVGVKIKPSTDPKKKIDVFDFHDNYITSIGATGYSDFASFIETHGLDYALKKRELYQKRHKREIASLGDEWPGSRSYYSWSILW